MCVILQHRFASNILRNEFIRQNAESSFSMLRMLFYIQYQYKWVSSAFQFPFYSDHLYACKSTEGQFLILGTLLQLPIQYLADFIALLSLFAISSFNSIFVGKCLHSRLECQPLCRFLLNKIACQMALDFRFYAITNQFCKMVEERHIIVPPTLQRHNRRMQFLTNKH